MLMSFLPPSVRAVFAAGAASWLSRQAGRHNRRIAQLVTALVDESRGADAFQKKIRMTPLRGKGKAVFPIQRAFSTA